MKIRQIDCKTALSPSRLPGLDYSLNPYRGCEHNCAYCYVPNVLRISRENWGNFVYVKVNIPLILSKELKRKKPGVVAISTVTDPYQSVEEKYKLTMHCLEQLLRYDFPISIQTKSHLVLRDIDLISQFSDAEVGITVTTPNDGESKILEPCASSISNRLDTVKKLNDCGIKTFIFFGPIYPTIKIDDIQHIVKQFSETGTTKLIVDSLHLKRGVWKNLESNLSSHPSTLASFQKNLFENKDYYSAIFGEIERQCKNYKLNFEKAF
jgi:DNA repair photolyase